jgi:hypothetical protein
MPRGATPLPFGFASAQQRECHRLHRPYERVGALPRGCVHDLLMNFAKRAARNEEVIRGINKQIEEGAELHGAQGPMPFHCECGQTTCLEQIDLPPSSYEKVLADRYRFIVLPGHEQPAIERVVEDRDTFLIVEKIGQAREQIDEDHPQHTHGNPDQGVG